MADGPYIGGRRVTQQTPASYGSWSNACAVYLTCSSNERITVFGAQFGSLDTSSTLTVSFGTGSTIFRGAIGNGTVNLLQNPCMPVQLDYGIQTCSFTCSGTCSGVVFWGVD